MTKSDPGKAGHRAVSSGARSGETLRKGRHREWTEARNAAGLSRRGGKREQRRYNGGQTRRAVSSAPTAGARSRRSATAAGRPTATARHAQKAAARERRTSRAGGRRRESEASTRGQGGGGRTDARDRGRRRRQIRHRVGTKRATKRMGNGASLFFPLFGRFVSSLSGDVYLRLGSARTQNASSVWVIR